MISDLLTASNGALLVPLAIVLASAKLVAGLFGLHRSKSQDRKEFLELWRNEPPDDLWLEVAVRHLIGEYLPASVIRSLQTAPQAGRALIEIGDCWPLVEMDDETGHVHWRGSRYSTPKRRRFWSVLYAWGYYVCVGAGLLLAYELVKSASSNTSILWAYAIALTFIGLWCLWSSDRLRMANKALPRWLGLP